MRYGEESGPLAIAHRGGMALGPENTLHTFERATALGVRYLETDVRTTRDGHVVCFHDTTLKRVTGAAGGVGDLTLGATRRLRVDGREPIPSLAEALDAFAEARFAIDLKDLAAGPALVDLLRGNPGWASRVCLAGSWSSRLLAVQAAVPEVTTALGWRALTALLAASHSGARPPARIARGTFAHVPLRLGRVPIHAERVVRRSHQLGIKVSVWTVNDQATMHRLLDAGVDGLITDRPDLLREVLIARGQWTSRPSHAAERAVRPQVLRG